MTRINFEKVFDDYVADTQKVWEHDRTKSVGASEIFGCMRKTFFTKRGAELGYEKDPDYKENWGATRRGDLIEAHHVVPALEYLPEPVEAWFAGEDQITIQDGYNSCTPDGLLVNCDRDALVDYGVEDIGSSRIMLEIKSIDPRSNLKEEKAIHRGQTITQMGMVRDKCKDPDNMPHYGVILYVDASFLDDMDVFIIPYDDEVYKAAKIRAPLIWKHDDPIKFTAEGKLNGQCDYCPFTHACAKSTNDAIPEKSKNGTPQKIIDHFEPLMSEYKAKQDALKKAEAEFEEIKLHTKSEIVDAGRSNVESDDWRTSYYSVKGKKKLNRKAMEDDGIDLSKYETRGAGHDVLRITFKD